MAPLYAQQQKSSFSPRSPRESYKLMGNNRRLRSDQVSKWMLLFHVQSGSEHHSVSERQELNSAPTSPPLTIRKKRLMEIRREKAGRKRCQIYFLFKTITRSKDHIRYHIIATDGARYAGRGFSNFPLIHQTELSIHMKWGINLCFQAAQCQSKKNLCQLLLQLANATELVLFFENRLPLGNWPWT